MSKNLQDTRSQSLGRPLKRELTLEEKYAGLEAQNALLKAENEFLKRERSQRERQDEKINEIALKAYHFKRSRKGARSIKMTLEGQFQIVYNLKRISRIMKNTP